MNLLRHAYKASVWQRKLFALLAIAFLFTSSHVQAAEFSQAVAAPAQDFAVATGLEDVTRREEKRSVEDAKPIATLRSTMTAYSSTPFETDDSPFVTATGACVRDGIVAANFLPFGTKLRIPQLFGDKVFEVQDRMNARYSFRIDVWMKDANQGREFGIKRGVLVEILERGNGKKSWEEKNTNRGCQKIAALNGA